MKKQNLKRFGSALLATALICGSLSTQSYANDKKTHWADETLKQWEADGLLKKDNTGSFRPDDFVTRAEFMALTNRALGLTKESDAVSTYKDVDTNAWYYHDIAKALAAGYIKGTSADEMNPAGQLTNEQAYSILARIANADGSMDLKYVVDNANISDWARKNIEQAIANGYVAGSEGKINPSALVNRAQTITLLDRYKNEDRVFAFPGEYSVKSARNVTVLVNGVTLKNMTISGNLILGPEAKTIKTVNTTIKGATLRKSADEVLEDLALKDGVYEGVAEGYSGQVRLQVTVKDGKITDVKVLSQSETPAYWRTVQPLLSKIVEKGTTDGIDAISGATLSSNAIFNAVADALSQAKGKTKSVGESAAAKTESGSDSSENSGYTPTEPNKNDYSDAPLPDGTYTGSATGYGGTITVTVTVANGVIADIKVDSHNESGGYYENALVILDKVVKKNSTDVDTISGATVTSKGLLSAVENALSKVRPKAKTEYADGVWYGQGRGHYSTDHVEILSKVLKTSTEAKVEVKDGKIIDVKLVYHGDDESYLRKDGYALIADHIIKNNSTVGLAKIFADKDFDNPIYDGISSATNSARGYVNAIEDALQRSAKFKKDQIEQEVRSIILLPHTHHQKYYGDVLDLSDLKLQVNYLDGRNVEVPFEKIAEYGITCTLPISLQLEPAVANNYSQELRLELLFLHTNSTSKHRSDISVKRKVVNTPLSKIQFITNEGHSYDIPLDKKDSDFNYDFHIPQSTFSGIKNVVVYDDENNPVELKSFELLSGKIPTLRVELQQVPTAEDSDPVQKNYRFVTYRIKLTTNVPFDKDNISRFEIDTSRVKTNYYVGDTLDLNGLVVYATDSNYKEATISLNELADNGFTIKPENGSKLNEAGTKVVTIEHSKVAEGQSFEIAIKEKGNTVHKLDIISSDNGNNNIIASIILQPQESYYELTLSSNYLTDDKYKDLNVEIYWQEELNKHQYVITEKEWRDSYTANNKKWLTIYLNNKGQNDLSSNFSLYVTFEN